ncbi:MAG: dihydroorotate dehydrogenase electron transfer subunit, partial [Candidatus Aminicenantales bacterium]
GNGVKNPKRAIPPSRIHLSIRGGTRTDITPPHALSKILSYCQRTEILILLFEKSWGAMVKDPEAQIIESKNWNDYFLISFKSSPIAEKATPGQFLMVRVTPEAHPLLRRPFSIHSCRQDSLEIFFKRSGAGTSLLAETKKGETLDIIGPLGKGFTIPGKGIKTSFLVGGGRGIAPLFFLARELKENNQQVKVFYGGKSIEDLCLREKFQKEDLELACSTEDGSYGYKGLVTGLLTLALEAEKPDFLYACGPDLMMEKIAHLVLTTHIPAEFSLESTMGCGFGACWGCVQSIKKDGKEEFVKICQEGPVFRGEEIVW